MKNKLLKKNIIFAERNLVDGLKANSQWLKAKGHLTSPYSSTDRTKVS